jgi:hypothetical protein
MRAVEQQSISNFPVCIKSLRDCAEGEAGQALSLFRWVDHDPADPANALRDAVLYNVTHEQTDP